ncbi:MAG: hypothetical protein KBA61_13565, partial [Spirochaetes bacterium]|nr:hypothetical protein [Spirochaetota bacterium]
MVSSLFKNPSLASIIVFAGVGIGISFIGSLNLFSSINRENISHYVTSLTGLLFLTTTVLVIQREINI